MKNPFTTKKVALFSDIHIGLHGDSLIWHKVALDFADWFITVLEKEKIKDVIFCGDFFHYREEVNQTTLDCGTELLIKFKNYNIIMIPGNHCCYYKNNADIHSLKPFKEWSNITVLDKLTTIEYNKKTLTFCPWGIETKDIPISDIIFGHFEITNFKINSIKICEHGEDSSNLLEKGKTIISGHFHTRDHRKYENGEILYLGSPFEQNFGEINHQKGITILDLSTMNYKFVENTISPKHIKVSLKDIIEKKINLKTEIIGNVISLIVDEKLNEDTLNLVVSKIALLKPLQFKTEFEYEDIITTSKDIEKCNISIDEALNEFINVLITEVNKKDIYDKCIELYNNSRTITEN